MRHHRLCLLGAAGKGAHAVIYWELFWSFLQIGLFSIGGGYAAMPLIQNQVVELHSWLTMTQFSDIVTIAEMTPGPIAINASTFVGIQVAGLPGALVATLGCIFPSCVIVLALAWVYRRYGQLRAVQGVLGGLRPGVVAMIASAGLSILLLSLFGASSLPPDPSGFNPVSLGIFSLALALLRWRKPNPIWIMCGAGALGVLVYGFLL